MASGYVDSYSDTYAGLPPATVVSQWSNATNGAPYADTPKQVGIANSPGNWLLAIVSWQSTQDQALAFATDDGHNFWRPLGIQAAPSSGLGAAVPCTAVLAVPNARAATEVSISWTAPVRYPCINIVEVAGLPTGLQLDDIQVSTASGTTSFTMTCSPGGSDFVLSAVSFSKSNSVLSATGWNLLNEVDNLSGTPVIQGGSAWKTGGSSVTWTSAAAGSWAGVMVALSVTATAASSGSNPAFPLIQCQAGFGYTPGTPLAYVAWTDITNRFLGFNGQRGRQFELDQLESADISITLRNDDGALNPVNTASPFYPNVTAMTPIRVIATWQGRTYPVFTGYVLYWPQTFDEGAEYSVVQAQCADDFSNLSQVLFDSCMHQEILYDKPWAFWPLFDAQGSTFAANISGRSQYPLILTRNALEPTGAPESDFGTSNTDTNGNELFSGDDSTIWRVFVDEFAGYCLEADDIPDFPSVSNGMTIELWAKFSASNAIPTFGLIYLTDRQTPTFIAGSNFGEGPVLKLGYDNTSDHMFLKIWLNDWSTLQHTLSFAPRDGNWHHHVITVSPSLITYYIDGAVADSMSSFGTLRSLKPSSISVNGHSDSLSSNNCGQGDYSKAVVYDRILDPERIVAHYNSGINGFGQHAGGSIFETTGPRISRFLRWAHWGAPAFIDDGTVHQQRIDYLTSGYASSGVRGSFGEYATPGGGNASGAQADTVIEDVAGGETGLLFQLADGTLAHIDKDSLYNRAPVATFGENAAAGETPYEGDIEFDFDITYLYNDITVTRNIDSAAIRAVDQASKAQYRGRTYSRTVYVSGATASGLNDNNYINLVNALLNQYKQPRLRVANLTVKAANNPSAWKTVLAVETGDIVTVTRRAVGWPQPISQDFLVINISPDLEPDTGTWVYVMTPILSPVLTLDDAKYGVLGSNVLGW